MTESERLKCVIEYYKMSTNKFAEYIGLKSAQNLYDVLKGRNGISKDLSEKIKALCVNVNISWLLTGEGEMLKNTSETIQKTEVKDISESETIKELIAAIKRRDEDVAALIRTNEKHADNFAELLLLIKKTDARPGCGAASVVAI